MTEEKKGFKRTDIGLIPEDWKLITLEELTQKGDLIRGPFGGALKKEFFVDRGYKVYEQKNAIYSDYTLGSYFVDEDKFWELRRFEVQPDDFIVSCSGTIGRIYQIPEDALKGIINQALLIIRLDPDKIILPYFLNYFRWENFQDRIIDSTQGGAMKNLVGMDKFRATQIPIPPTLEEQQAIASALSDVDDLIRSLDGLIQKKQAIKKGTMQQLLTGKKRLPRFDGAWEVKKLGECFDFLKTGTQSRSDLNSHGDIGYIHYGDIHSKWDLFLDCDNQAIPKIDIEKVKSLPTLQEGDLIIADASEDYEGVGKSIEIKNIGERNIVAGLHTMLLRAKNELLADGYKAYITSIDSVKKKLAQIATGTTVYGLSKTKLKEVEIYLPKSVEEQKAIAQILSDMDRELQTLRNKREKYVHIKQGMMQELLTGRVRLV